MLQGAASSLWLAEARYLLWILDLRIAVRLAVQAWGWDLLCSAGLASLWRLPTGESLRVTAAALSLAAAGSSLFALARGLSPGMIAAFDPALPILRWTGQVGVAALCIGVSRLCRRRGAERAAESWITTVVIFLLSATGSQAMLAMAGAPTSSSGPQASSSLPVVLLAVAANCVPVAHSLTSAAKMQQAPQPASSVGRA